jgi:membrane protease YdiL (CAAX protease family)
VSSSGQKGKEAGLGVTALGAYLVGWVVFLIVLNVGALFAWMVMEHGVDGLTVELLGSLDVNDMPGSLLVVNTFLQFVGMGAMAMAAVVFMNVARTRLSLEPTGVARALALRGITLPMAVLALLGGATVGWLPGIVASWLREALPFLDLGALTLVTESITTGPILQRAGMILVVSLFGPVVEEITFRGFVWDALDRWMPTWLVLVGTSLLFSLFHMDPVQGIPLLFTGAFFAWLRWMSGSLLAPVLVHIVNNSLAVALQLAGVEDSSTPIGLFMGLVTIGFAVAAWFARAKPEAAGD